MSVRAYSELVCLTGTDAQEQNKNIATNSIRIQSLLQLADEWESALNDIIKTHIQEQRYKLLSHRRKTRLRNAYQRTLERGC